MIGRLSASLAADGCQKGFPRYNGRRSRPMNRDERFDVPRLPQTAVPAALKRGVAPGAGASVFDNSSGMTARPRFARHPSFSSFSRRGIRSSQRCATRELFGCKVVLLVRPDDERLPLILLRRCEDRLLRYCRPQTPRVLNSYRNHRRGRLGGGGGRVY